MPSVLDFYQANVLDTDYNGWTNYETWNVSLWIGNDEGLYNFAKDYTDYEELAKALYNEFGLKETPDGVKFDSAKINTFEMNDFLSEL